MQFFTKVLDNQLDVDTVDFFSGFFFNKNNTKRFGFYKKPYLGTIKIRESVFSPGLLAFLRKPGFFLAFLFEEMRYFWAVQVVNKLLQMAA